MRNKIKNNFSFAPKARELSRPRANCGPLLSLAILSFFILSGCGKTEEVEIKSEPAVSTGYPVMGTMAEVKLYGNPESAKSAADAIRNKFSAVEKACGRFDNDSELSKLNSTAGKEPFKCSDLLWEVLLESKRFYELSDGSFDITVAPLMELWGFYRKRNSLPSEKEIAGAVKHVGLNKVLFDMENHTIKFPEAGIKLDLGGIAKGYAVDCAASAAIGKGIKCGTINLGGNIRCLPEPPPGKTNYSVGVRNPVSENEICRTVQVLNTCLATSGNYEKYVTINGEKYTHIMNPLTGLPVKNMVAVTVVTPKGVDSDGLSTSIFIKGEDFARRICARMPGTSVLIIRPDPADLSKHAMIKIGGIWDNCLNKESPDVRPVPAASNGILRIPPMPNGRTGDSL